VLVTGAYGFLGAAVVRALEAEGAEAVGAGRDLELGRRLHASIRWIACDFNRDLAPEDWTGRLEGIDAVVNCVGILQSTAGDSAHRIHAQAPAALFEAARRAGVTRVVHISAMSAEDAVATAYAQSKREAETALARLDLDWIIVKPSLVIGPGSFGGTSVIRGLGGLPGILPVPAPGTQVSQPIALEDLAAGLARLALGAGPARTTLYAAGPETKTIAEVMVAVRRWLGFPAARIVHVPRWIMRPALWLGDLAGWLGSPSGLRSTALTQLGKVGIADPAPFATATGIEPRALDAMLAARPATLQDRLHARSFFLLPLTQIVIALFWIATGVIALFPGPAVLAERILLGAGLSADFAQWAVRAGAVADIVLGAAFLNARWTRTVGALQIALTLAYLAFLSAIGPELWADPTGPLLKALPVMAATLLVMALAEKR
jgi:uncharacterized protein YbjT (DUF2867 family)